MPPMLGNLIESFPEWSKHSEGIDQYVGKLHPFLFALHRIAAHDAYIAWTAFCANFQHYQKHLGHSVAKTWDVLPTWGLKVQLVFGTHNGPQKGRVEKDFADTEPRFEAIGMK